MSGVLSLWKKKNGESLSEEQELLQAIRDAARRMDHAYQRFELEKDEDLIESSIYEIESTKAQYRYLLREARERNLCCSPEFLRTYKEVSSMG